MRRFLSLAERWEEDRREERQERRKAEEEKKNTKAVKSKVGKYYTEDSIRVLGKKI